MYKDILVIDLSQGDLKMLEKVSKVAVQTNTLPKLYCEDLEDIVHKIDIQNPKWPCFIRFDSCSPKDAGCLKVQNSWEVVSVLVRSKRLYKIYSDNIPEKIILRPWDQNIWDNRDKNEHRVFVHNNKITAISQYDCYNNHNFSRFRISYPLIIEHIKEIQHQVETAFKLQSYVIDVFVGEPEQYVVQFIEINPFGMESPCGSCLFHWVDDQKILYGDGTNIQIRYVVQ
uniref:Putative cell division cycle protein n=1 Tax=Trepomonas sp. PC1 TaxID=1076344 RepID=A0A146KCP0_9EUKA|eukprot:JAP94552.1 Putative cell division cycle protein [Trepomonas sp. PC1]